MCQHCQCLSFRIFQWTVTFLSASATGREHCHPGLQSIVWIQAYQTLKKAFLRLAIPNSWLARFHGKVIALRQVRMEMGAGTQQQASHQPAMALAAVGEHSFPSLMPSLHTELNKPFFPVKNRRMGPPHTFWRALSPRAVRIVLFYNNPSELSFYPCL